MEGNGRIFRMVEISDTTMPIMDIFRSLSTF